MNRSSGFRQRENVCRRLPAARRRQKYEPGFSRWSSTKLNSANTAADGPDTRQREIVCGKRRSMNRSGFRRRENVCRRLPVARRRRKYEPGLNVGLRGWPYPCINQVPVRYHISMICIGTWIGFDTRYFRRKLAQNVKTYCSTGSMLLISCK